MTRLLLLPLFAIALTACAHHPPQTRSGKRLELQTIDHGPMKPKTYLYREVDAR